jgi:hypothetical protein
MNFVVPITITAIGSSGHSDAAGKKDATAMMMPIKATVCPAVQFIVVGISLRVTDQRKWGSPGVIPDFPILARLGCCYEVTVPSFPR